MDDKEKMEINQELQKLAEKHPHMNWIVEVWDDWDPAKKVFHKTMGPWHTEEEA